MKRCPFCGSEIEENARFCLYCMTSLTEKQVIPTGKRRKTATAVAVAVFAALLAVLLTATCLFWLPGKGGVGTEDSSVPEAIGVDATVSTTTADTGSGETTTDLTTSGRGGKTTVSTITDTPVSTSPLRPGSPSKGNTTGNTAKTTTAPTTTAATTLPTAPSTSATTQSGRDYYEVAWCVRSAYSFDYLEQYSHVAPEDAVVIVGLMSIPDDGVYVIPETIDGKTVVAVDFSLQQGYAFGDAAVRDTVKAVYLPSSVTKLCYDAFSACVNLTDVYVAGEYLYVEPSAFPSAASRNGTLTFHTAERALCLYSSAPFSVYCSDVGANEYQANWQLWGEEIDRRTPLEEALLFNKENEDNWITSPAPDFIYTEAMGSMAMEDAVIITRLSDCYNEVLVVPETIRGKTVVAISSLDSIHFSDLKTVYLPPSLVMIHGKVFAECQSLTDVYVAGKRLWIDPEAFSPAQERYGPLTLHTAEDAMRPSEWNSKVLEPFRTYCSAGGENVYEAAWQAWTDDLYGSEVTP